MGILRPAAAALVISSLSVPISAAQSASTKVQGETKRVLTQAEVDAARMDRFLARQCDKRALDWHTENANRLRSEGYQAINKDPSPESIVSNTAKARTAERSLSDIESGERCEQAKAILKDRIQERIANQTGF